MSVAGLSVAGMAPIVEASVFTLGCVGIHALRRYADRVTPVLATLALALAMTLLVALTLNYTDPNVEMPYGWAVL